MPGIEGVPQPLAELAASDSLAVDVRSVIVTAVSTVTLMAANAVPAGTVVRVYIDDAGVSGSVDGDGADTIDASGTPVALTAVSNALLILQSDGVSDWVSL